MNARHASFAGMRMPRRSRAARGLGRLLRWWAAVGALLLLAIAAFVAISGAAFDFQPLHVAIQGDDVFEGLHVTGLTPAAQALLVAGALVIVLVALLLAPLLLVIVGAALALGLAAALTGVGIGVAAATSPLWGIALIVWLTTRRRRARRAACEGARP